MTEHTRLIAHLVCPKCGRNSISIRPIGKSNFCMSRPTMLKTCLSLACDYEQEITFEQAMEEKYKLNTQN